MICDDSLTRSWGTFVYVQYIYNVMWENFAIYFSLNMHVYWYGNMIYYIYMYIYHNVDVWSDGQTRRERLARDERGHREAQTGRSLCLSLALSLLPLSCSHPYNQTGRSLLSVCPSSVCLSVRLSVSLPLVFSPMFYFYVLLCIYIYMYVRAPCHGMDELIYIYIYIYIYIFSSPLSRRWKTWTNSTQCRPHLLSPVSLSLSMFVCVCVCVCV
jgi:hypothetical protein